MLMQGSLKTYGEYFLKNVARLFRGSCQGRDLSEEDNKLEKNLQRKCDAMGKRNKRE